MTLTRPLSPLITPAFLVVFAVLARFLGLPFAADAGLFVALLGAQFPQSAFPVKLSLEPSKRLVNGFTFF